MDSLLPVPVPAPIAVPVPGTNTAATTASHDTGSSQPLIGTVSTNKSPNYPYCTCHPTTTTSATTTASTSTSTTTTTTALSTSTQQPHRQQRRLEESSTCATTPASGRAITGAPPGLQFFHRNRPPSSTIIISATAAPVRATAGAGSGRHPGPSSPSSSTSVLCASCNKPFAGPNTPRPLSSASSFSSLQPHPTPADRDEYWAAPQLQQRRQSHPEISRSIPGLVAQHAGDPLPRPRDYWPSRKSGRSRLSAPLIAPAYDRGRYRLPRHTHHATMVGSDAHFSSQNASASTSVSHRAVISSNDLSSVSRDGDTSSTKSHQSRPRKSFVTKSNGRTYLADPTNPYPLPVDLRELHRQSLRTLLLFQLFGGPLCSPAFAQRPPSRVLDLGCGYGFWSMMTHSYFSRKGHSNIKFTGMDIAPLGGIAGTPNLGNGTSSTPAKDRGSMSSASGNWAEQPPDKSMHWTFVQHDLRVTPLPFADEEFDLIMSKDMSLAVGTLDFQACMDEYLRCLKPGGVLEVWDCDHPIRMLRPHVPDTPTTKTASQPFDPDSSSSSANSSEPFNGGIGGNKNKGEHAKEMSELGAYVLGNNTPLSGPQNIYLIEYNSWILKVLDQRQLLNWPCANIGAYLLQEPLLTNHGSKRLAIPLTEVRWEREGVGGVVTKDGKSYIDTSKAVGRAKAPSPDGGTSEKKGKTLGDAQLALRETALHTVLGMIEGLEPALREVNEKKQDEWDAWMGKLRKELLERDGANCGECLEVGAWWSRKVQNPS